MAESGKIIIVGAGIAGVATAYHLSVIHGLQDVIIVDDRPPLSLTSDKSTEAYRNFWPGPDPSMVQLMNRSIQWLDKLAVESENVFQMNRRGYLFATADEEKIQEWKGVEKDRSTQNEKSQWKGFSCFHLHNMKCVSFLNKPSLFIWNFKYTRVFNCFQQYTSIRLLI